jgi:hypothetical protein
MRWLILVCVLACISVTGCEMPDPGHGVNLYPKNHEPGSW